jgi:PKHD-type hydroxylase
MKYLYYYQPMYTFDQCVEIKKNIVRDIKLCTGKDQAATGVKKTAVVDIAFWKHARDYLTEIEEFVKLTNERYFGLDIFELRDYIGVNFNQYTKKNSGEYSWHWDGTYNDIYDHKLTLVINVSTEAYQGGKFEIFDSGGPKSIPEIDQTGTAILFPSWLRHRVTPVTEGTRETISIWFTGPNFK